MASMATAIDERVKLNPVLRTISVKESFGIEISRAVLLGIDLEVELSNSATVEY